jgi:hypothetical protein
VAALGTASLLAVTGFAGHVAAASATLPTGAGMVLNAPIVGVAALPDGHGYWEVGADGGVFSFGAAGFYGSAGRLQLTQPVVGLEPTPDGRGYWEVARDGGVFAYGDAGFFGSAGGLRLAAPVVGMAVTPDGRGYWEVARDGGVFAFGDARFYGSAAGLSPASPIVGLAATATGSGYREVAADGAVFALGDAGWSGNAPAGDTVVGISTAGAGYRLASATGGVFAFGGASFYGSAGPVLNRPVVGITATADGYLMVGADGGVYSFGGVGFYGSLGEATVVTPPAPVSAPPANDGVTAGQIAAWDRVNECEEGGVWDVVGAEYSGGLGFSNANWSIFNTCGYPANAGWATPDEQIRVAVAFATAYWGNPDAAPDQDGCSGGY